VTIGRNVPRVEAGWREDNHEFLKNGSKLFFAGALERADPFERLHETRFHAQASFMRKCQRKERL
jgi:hypothetical protein